MERVGFYKEFGSPGIATCSGEQVSAQLLSELAGLLVIAATIRLDAGYKAPTKLLATLTAIRENPKLVLSDTIEPEARGVLAAAYQRANEPAGTFWFDIDVESNLGTCRRDR